MDRDLSLLRCAARVTVLKTNEIENEKMSDISRSCCFVLRDFVIVFWAKALRQLSHGPGLRGVVMRGWINGGHSAAPRFSLPSRFLGWQLRVKVFNELPKFA